MSRFERKTDSNGFLLPASFSDLPKSAQRDDVNFGGPKTRPVLSSRALAWKRRIIWLFIISTVVFVVGVKFRKDILSWMAKSQVAMGFEEMQNNNFDGARSYFDWAIRLDDTHWESFYLRAGAQNELNELDASYNDYTTALEMSTDKSGKYGKDNQRGSIQIGQAVLHLETSDILQYRSMVLYRLDRFDEANADMDRAIEIAQNDKASLYNTRAYLRALTNRKLKEALDDVDIALKSIPQSPEFLDTRGYILHLLGENEAALEDLNMAIQDRQMKMRMDMAMFGRKNPRLVRAKHDISVMLYHRSLVHKALEHADDAEADLDKALRFGYDPKKGVF